MSAESYGVCPSKNLDHLGNFEGFLLVLDCDVFGGDSTGARLKDTEINPPSVSHRPIYLFVCVWSLIVHLDLDCPVDFTNGGFGG